MKPCLLIFLAALNAAFGAEANHADTAKTQSTEAEVPHADWAGLYTIMTAKDLAGTGFAPVAPGAQLDKVIIAHLQPWAKARLEATDGVADDTGAVCLPDGPFRYPVNAGTYFWLPEPGRIGIVSREVNTAGARRVRLDSEHPRNPVPTYNGDSVGHWDGDVLTIDSTGFNDKSWLMAGREPHTEEVHMVEKVRRILDGSVMEFIITIDDRKTLTSAYTFKRYYKKLTQDMPEDVCAEEPEIWKEFRNTNLRKDLEKARQVE